MAKASARFVCQTCGAVTTKWSGRCDGCGEWNTIKEEVPLSTGPGAKALSARGRSIPLTDLSATEAPPPRTMAGLPELDRVLGGGLVAGSAVLVGGDPGIGKSTLLLQAAAAFANAGLKVIYVSGEEASAQVRLRAQRLGLEQAAVKLASETSLRDILTTLDEESPDLSIKIEGIQLNGDQKIVLKDINQFSWIVFTSPNGIHFFFKNLKEINGDYQLPPSIKTAVVGNKTKSVLAEYGHEATLENPGTTGADLAEEMKKALNSEDFILFPEGDLARATIAKQLSPIAQCVPLVVYKNLMPKTINQDILQQIIDNQYHSIILTSPSSFNNLIIALNNRVSNHKLRLVCIGTTTAAEVEKNGIQPITTASMTSAQGIVDAILNYVVNNE